MADSYGSAQEAGGAAQVAGAGVRDVVVTANGLLGGQRFRARCGSAHDAVGTVGLVRHAGVRSRTHYVGAGLCQNTTNTFQFHDFDMATTKGEQF